MKRVITLAILMFIGVSVKAQSQLDDYLRIAARQNPQLKAKFNDYLASLERVKQEEALPDPTLSFGYFISPVETRVGPQRFRLSVSQMFPWMGTLKAREKVAANQAKAKFEEFQETRNQLFLRVKSKWLELFELEREIRIMEENLEILQSYEPITKTKYEANLVSLADLVRVQIGIDRGNTELKLLRLKRKPLRSDFNTMLNQDASAEVHVPDTLNFKSITFDVESVMLNQPRLKQLKSNLMALEQEGVLADLRRKPKIGVGLDYGFVGKREGVAIADNGKDFFMPQVSISLPVFGKKNRSIKKEVALRTDSKRLALVALENELSNKWENIDYEAESARESQALYLAEIAKTEVLLRVLIGEYTNNHEDFETLLQTQQRQLELRLAHVKATVKLQQASFMKDYLTGYTLNEIENEIK